MRNQNVGISVSAPDAATALSSIRKAEEMGIRAAWLTSGGAGSDAMTLLAAAAAQTERILLGTSIMQTWSRHPVAAAQQVQVIASLAPGRFRLGVGPGHKESMQRTFGADFRAPVGHLREYLRVLKGLLHQGAIDFDGRYYTARTKISGPVDVPVMASALRARSFELCGAEADGAISWSCPLQYLWDVALPALRTGAEQAGHPAPPLIVHAPVCVSDDASAVRDAVRRQLGGFPGSPLYTRMFAVAGFPRSDETGWTDEMLDSVTIWGGEASVAHQFEQMFESGASEILATVIDAGEGSEERTMRLIAQA